MVPKNRKPVQKRVTLPEITLHRKSPPLDARLIYPYGRFSEQEYLAPLAGKRVIIVGPAGYLKDKGLGEWIDLFDVVVRVNHAYPIKYPSDYGTRTDILYHIMSHRGEEEVHKKLVTREEIETWRDEGLKWLVISQGPLSNRVKAVAPLIDSAFPWACVHDRFSERIKKSIGSKSPNTGIKAIMHLLSSGLKELRVVGFDFYSSGVYSGYGDLREKEDALTVNERWHDIEAQKKYMRAVVRRESRLKIDERLSEVLHA